jgi:hypothetical protein
MNFYGTWSNNDSDRSSTWRELMCFYIGLKSFEKSIQECEVKWYTDCKNLIYVVKKGSKVGNLHKIVCDINKFCLERKVHISVIWIPRENNLMADKLSRCFDSDDWGISYDIFAQLNKEICNFTIDRFATNYNKKCDRFNSRWWCEECETMNSMDQSWEGENNWIVPPISMLIDVLHKIDHKLVPGVIILPRWQSAAFWPVLKSMVNRNRIKFVQKLPRQGTILSGRGNNGVFCDPLNFDMIVYKINVNKI